MSKVLIFVYNAKSGILSKSLDIAHKIISPSTYSCDLCSLTHGYFSEKQRWRDFIENTNTEFVFMYKDEFLKFYLTSEVYNFPIILRKKGERIEVILDSEELTSLQSVEKLIKLLERRM